MTLQEMKEIAPRLPGAGAFQQRVAAISLVSKF